jgi:hypothetical protein
MLKTVSSVTNALGALVYQGTWDASANNPTLTSSVGTKGNYYVVSVAGTTTLNGISSWSVGDWAVFNGSVWQKVDGGTSESFVNLTVTGTANIATGNVVNMTSSNVTITGGTENAVTYTNVTVSSGNITVTNDNVAYSNISTALRTQSLTGYLYGNANTGNVTASTSIPNTSVSGLGTMSTQNSNSVTITGGNVGANLSTSTAIPVANATGTLATTHGGTGLTSFTVNGIPYASSSSVLNTSASLQFISPNVLGLTGNLTASVPSWSVTGNQTALQLGTIGSVSSLSNSTGNQQLNIGRNVYDFYSAKYITSDTASCLRLLGDNTFAFYQASSGTAGNSITFTQPMTLFGSGGVSIGNTTDPGAANLSVSGNVIQATAAKGFNFTANTSLSGMSSQLLKWYEEGTWTTTLTPATSGTITLNSNYNLCSYTQIGRVMMVQGQIQVQSVSSPVGGYIKLLLPKNIATGSQLSTRFGGALYYDGGVLQFNAQAGNNYISIIIDASTVGTGGSGNFNFSFSYIV